MTLGHFLRAAASSSGRQEDLDLLRTYLDRRIASVRECKSGDEENGEATRAKGAKTASNPEQIMRRQT